MHRLPPILSRLDEATRVHLACAAEGCDILEGELSTAEHQYRRMILLTRTYHLRFLNAQREHTNASAEVDAAVEMALRDVFTVTNDQFDEGGDRVGASSTPLAGTEVSHQSGQ